jgi:RNA polymerase sigma-70 factor (ECF subfamily)
MLAVRDGDAAAFERLFANHIAAVVGYATQLLGSRARAEEIAQDVFMHIHQARHRYVPSARFRTWMYRIVTNACRSELRRPERRLDGAREVRVEPQVDPPVPHSHVAARTGEEILLTRDVLAKIQQVLASLPPQQRAALLLARVEGMSYQEVAAALSCSVAAVKSLVHRATVTLREKVPEEGD